MSLVLHLFKKDFRRSYLLLAVWLLLVLLQCALMGSSLHPGRSMIHGIYWGFSNIGPLLKSIVVAVLIAFLILEESPSGTTAFWFTRPLPRVTVLRTKGLFLLLLVALPLLTEVGVLFAGGVIRHDVALAVPEIILTELQWMLLVAVIASLTANFGQFAIASAVVWVATILFGLAAQWLSALRSSPLDYVTMQGQSGLWHSRTIVGGLLMIFGFGTVFIHQYLTRRNVRSIVLALVFELAAIAAQYFSPWNFFPSPPAPPAEIKVDASAIKLQLRASEVQDMFVSQTGGEPKKNLTGQLLLVGVPSGYMALPTKVHPRLSFPDGHALPVEDPLASNYIFEGNAKAIESVLGGAIILNGQRGGTVPTGLALLRADTFRKYAGQPFTYSADIDFDLVKFVIVADMPLAKGSHNDRGSAHEFITDVLQEGAGVDVILHRRDVNLLFQRPKSNGENGRFLTSLGGAYTNRTYLLRNRRNGEAVLAKMNGVNRLFETQGNSRLVQEDWSLSFGPDNYRGEMAALDQAWLADAELIELEMVTSAQFSEPLTVSNFILEGPNRAKTLAPQEAAPSAAALAPLPSLPAGASKAEVRKYVDLALVLSQRWTTFQKTDPPVAILVKVGPDNLDVLIDALDRTRSSYPARLYLEEAILELARPQDKSLVLGALVADPTLVDVVVKFNWQGDCREVLLAMIRDENQSYLPLNWIRAVASFKDPTTYPLLKAYLLRAGRKQPTYNAIRKLPGIDLRETIDAVWKHARRGAPDDRFDAATVAIDVGYPDALETLVGFLRDKDLSQPQLMTRAATLIKRYTPATGDGAALVAWYDANRARLVFDAEKRKFILLPTAAGSGA